MLGSKPLQPEINHTLAPISWENPALATNAAVDTVDSNSLPNVIAQVAGEPLTEQGFEEIALTAFASEKNFEGMTSLLKDWASVENTIPSKVTSELIKGFCALIVGQADVAAETLRPHKSDPWGAYHLARSCLDNGNAADAVAIAGVVHAEQADFLPLAQLLVEAHTRLKQFDEANAILEKIKAVAGNSGTYHFANGRDGDTGALSYRSRVSMSR